MPRRRILALFIVSILSLSILGMMMLNQSSLRNTSPIKPAKIETLIVEQLDLGPRIPGSEGSLAFRDWLIGKIPDGWMLKIQNFTYLGVECRNYIITSSTLGVGNYPDLLIGAHYDTRRIADQDDTNPTAPVPGANDGASGVAAILEMINYIDPPIKDNIGFLLFDAEDQGSGGMPDWSWIVGSTYYVDNMSDAQVNATSAFVLLDMIGNDDLVMKYEGFSDKVLSEEIWDVGIDLGYGDIFKKEVAVHLIDDHRPFLLRGIPAVDLIDFSYPEWHTTDDDLDAISSEKIAIVTDTVFQWSHQFLGETIEQTNSSTPLNTDTNQTDSTNSLLNFQGFVMGIFVLMSLKIFMSTTSKNTNRPKIEN